MERRIIFFCCLKTGYTISEGDKKANDRSSVWILLYFMFLGVYTRYVWEVNKMAFCRQIYISFHNLLFMFVLIPRFAVYFKARASPCVSIVIIPGASRRCLSKYPYVSCHVLATRPMYCLSTLVTGKMKGRSPWLHTSPATHLCVKFAFLPRQRFADCTRDWRGVVSENFPRMQRSHRSQRSLSESRRWHF